MSIPILTTKFVMLVSIAILFAVYKLARGAGGADAQVGTSPPVHELARLTFAGLVAGLGGAALGMLVEPSRFASALFIDCYVTQCTLCGLVFGLFRLVPSERALASILPIVSSKALMSRIRSSRRLPSEEVLYLGIPLSHRFRSQLLRSHHKPPLQGPLMEEMWNRRMKGRHGLSGLYLSPRVREMKFNAMQYESFAAPEVWVPAATATVVF